MLKEKNEYKNWRDLKSIRQKSVFNELEECYLHEKVTALLEKLLIGEKINATDLVVKEKNIERQLFNIDSSGWVQALDHLDIEYKLNTVDFFSFSPKNDNKYYIDERNTSGIYDTKFMDENSPFNPNIEALIRTILPTPDDTIRIDKKILTPVSIIIPAGKPVIEEINFQENKKIKKCSSSWRHIIIKPHDDNENHSKAFIKNCCERFFMAFKMLGLSAMFSGRSIDNTIFEDLVSNHPILKQGINFTEESSLATNNKVKYLKELNPSDDCSIEKKYGEARYLLKKDLKFIRIASQTLKNSGASIIDTDVISTGVMNLTTLTNATVITFYIEDDSLKSAMHIQKMDVRPYIIAHRNIIDMFLDLRDYGPRIQHDFAKNEHGGLNRRMILRENPTHHDENTFKKIMSFRDVVYEKYFSPGSLIKKPLDFKAPKNKVKRGEQVKISNFRTNLGFRICYLFNPVLFGRCRIDPNPDLKINAPLAYRRLIDDEFYAIIEKK